MSTSTATLPKLRSDAVVQRLSDEDFVVKLPTEREYFSVGAGEAFLLKQFDGIATIDSLLEAFEKEFKEEISARDVDEFIEIAKARKLLESSESDGNATPSLLAKQLAEDDDDEDVAPSQQQSLLFYRVPLFDPDRTFAWLEPQIRWVWSRAFVAVSIAAMCFALLILVGNWEDVTTSFSESWRWETVALAWLIITAATALHECAHGLTCKHFGGEVHDTGIMLLFFMPCLYCNVSDAWLIPQRSKRLLITAAGGYCDLCLWAVAVFVWRMTVPDCLVNYLAFVVLTVCGTRGAINFNPLLRLDGYYLLSDWLNLPNLRRRSQEYLMAHLRCWLWGAVRPKKESRGGVLFCYGAMAWLFAIGFLNIVFLRMLKYVSDEFGLLGVVSTSLLIVFAFKRVFRGFFKSECMTMNKTRHKRTLAWLLGGAAIPAVLFIVPVKHYATGDFEVRPGDRHEIHAPVTGFISRILIEEGSRVKKGDPLVQLKSPDLETQISTKEAELRGVEANLGKLRLGPRPEQLTAMRDKAARLRNWVKLGHQELERAREAYKQELQAIDQRIERTKTQWEFAKQNYAESEKLFRLKALAGVQLKSEQLQLTVLSSQIAEAEADRRVKEANGLRNVEAEISRREQELADVESQLDLLQAGTRPEEIAAEVARQEQLQEQLRFLNSQKEKLIVRSTVSGVVATPRMHEKIGQLATQGLTICVIENGSTSRVEIAVGEDDVLGVTSGQQVILKARALPFDTFEATVEHIATAATQQSPKQRNVLVVHCELNNQDGRLHSGMTGFGRIFRGNRTLGNVMLSKAMRYLRTEFWW
ncbi:MAG: efflux RND transporter periplasmic adaptor subunit [Planctomycetaceae bacterium]